MKRNLLFVILMVVGLSSCTQWWNKDEDWNNPYKGMTAKQLFTSSKEKLANAQYASASKTLEGLESMYPFSKYAEQAQLDLIYAYYKNEEYPSAAATAERFIHLYPRAKKVDYAYYMKGLANFQQRRGVFSKWLPLDESYRDPGTQSMAYSDFATLVQKFPRSKYKPNALQRMIYLRNMFAQRELNAANYYYERKMYVAASERSSFLIKNYPQAPSAKKALIVLNKAKTALKLKDASEDANKVLKATYS